MAKKKFSELSPGQQKAVVALGTVQVLVTTWAGRDLARRSRKEVRGSKLLWGLALPIQPFGPVGYLLIGRRRVTPAN